MCIACNEQVSWPVKNLIKNEKCPLNTREFHQRKNVLFLHIVAVNLRTLTRIQVVFLFSWLSKILLSRIKERPLYPGYQELHCLIT